MTQVVRAVNLQAVVSPSQGIGRFVQTYAAILLLNHPVVDHRWLSIVRAIKLRMGLWSIPQSLTFLHFQGLRTRKMMFSRFNRARMLFLVLVVLLPGCGPKLDDATLEFLNFFEPHETRHSQSLSSGIQESMVVRIPENYNRHVKTTFLDSKYSESMFDLFNQSGNPEPAFTDDAARLWQMQGKIPDQLTSEFVGVQGAVGKYSYTLAVDRTTAGNPLKIHRLTPHDSSQLQKSLSLPYSHRFFQIGFGNRICDLIRLRLLTVNEFVDIPDSNTKCLRLGVTDDPAAIYELVVDSTNGTFRTATYSKDGIDQVYATYEYASSSGQFVSLSRIVFERPASNSTTNPRSILEIVYLRPVEIRPISITDLSLSAFGFEEPKVPSRGTEINLSFWLITGGGILTIVSIWISAKLSSKFRRANS